MSYIKNDFLLRNKTAEKLYHTYAEKMPIIDYHCHLSEKQILENKPIEDIYEVWLSGDHYKWRLMRNYGVGEEYITGDKSRYEKFCAYCAALGSAFGNPLYHWSQLELEKFFDCRLEINEKNAAEIWRKCNEYIKVHNVTPQSLIESANVTHVFTTNEIFDNLEAFGKIAEKGYKFKVIPSFRADKIMNIEADGYNGFVDRLGNIRSFDELKAALEKRLDDFIKVGARASDISVRKIYEVPSEEAAKAVFEKRRSGQNISEAEEEIFKGYLTYFLMKLYARRGIGTELHIGAMRNNNSAMYAKLGADTGYDSIACDDSIAGLSRLFDRLESEKSLPKTIVFNLNPKMNAEIMTLLGCFQSDEARGKLQYGPAWWFLDNKAGIERHLLDLTATGHIATFVGMLTDSRSLLSYTRHHYFRRILCSFFGEMIERGEMTADIDFVGGVIEDVCYNNAVRYFDCI